MIRDGIITDEKSTRWGKKAWKSIKLQDNLTNMKFQSWTYMTDLIWETGDYEYFKQIMDPYALMLYLGIYEPVNIPEVSEKCVDEDLRCKEVWGVLKRNDKEEIMELVKKTDDSGEKYLRKIAKGKNINDITVKEILRAITKYRVFFIEDAYNSWVLQPDPEAFAFSVISNYTIRKRILTQFRITPAVGVPINMMEPKRNRLIRFPCYVSENLFSWDRVQVHKFHDEVRIFDKNGRKFEYKEETMKEILKLQISGLFDAVVSEEGKIRFYDILCIQDVWVYDRPLTERIKYFWNFAPNDVKSNVCWSWEEIAKLWKHENVLVRNLNREYSPVLKDAWIFPFSQIVQLKVKGKGEGKYGHSLQTLDNKIVFLMKGWYKSRRIGWIVDVDKDGNILRFREDLTIPESSQTIEKVWGSLKPNKRKITWRCEDGRLYNAED